MQQSKVEHSIEWLLIFTKRYDPCRTWYMEKLFYCTGHHLVKRHNLLTSILLVWVCGQKRKKKISVLLPQTDIGRWAYCLFLIPTSTEVCASARKKKTFVPPPHHFQLLTNQHMTHRSVMNDGILCCGSRTIHMKYLWQHSLYILLFVFKHFTQWNLEETLATNRCERDKDKFPLYKHRQGCALWKVEWIQPFCPEKEIARWQDKSHLVFLDFLLFSNKESTHAELLRETALTRTLPDATRSLWW